VVNLIKGQRFAPTCTRLMAHIIKWKSQPEKRSRSWIATIYNARREIRDIQQETPSLTDNIILEMWEDCFEVATLDAEGEMNKEAEISTLSWKAVFEEEYRIKDNCSCR